MSEHAASIAPYLRVFAALMVLTAVTVGVAYLDLGMANTLVAIAIATVKAVLVLLIFMHLRESKHLTWVFALSGFFGLLLLFLLLFGDYMTRSWLPIYWM